MNRKRFLSSVIGMTAIAPLQGFGENGLPVDRPARIPPYLQPGDTVGITSPAGYITEEGITPAVEQIRSWGYAVKMGRTIGRRYFGFGGTDEERLADFQAMINDPSVKAILCARGGYGVIRILDRIDFRPLETHPKWIIGFSDITALHAHLNRNLALASLHSKMCNSFPKSWQQADEVQKETIRSIQRALSGQALSYSFPPSEFNRAGVAEGELVGGNLKMLESLSGTASDLYTNGKLLFVEDTGEYLYSIDRMFWNLRRSGKLVGLKGLILGGFKVKPDDPGEEFGISLQEIIWDKIKDYPYPVCFDFPVGHQKNNFALKCGVKYRLAVGAAACTLEEV